MKGSLGISVNAGPLRSAGGILEMLKSVHIHSIHTCKSLSYAWCIYWHHLFTSLHFNITCPLPFTSIDITCHFLSLTLMSPAHFPFEHLQCSTSEVSIWILCIWILEVFESKLFEYHSVLVDLQQSSALTHQCRHFLTSFISNGDIISHRKAKTAFCIFKT